MSVSTLQRCWPMRFRGTHKGVWSPPCQRTTRPSALSLDAHDDLLDERADDPLAGGWRGARAVPSPLEISAECEQAIPVGGGQHRQGACRQRVPFVFQAAHSQETLVPASLQLRCDEAVGVDGIVLPPCTGGFVTRLLEGEFDVALLLGLLDPARLQGI